MNISRRQWVQLGLWTSAAAAVGFVAGHRPEESAATEALLGSGDEAVLVYLGSSTCQFSNADDLPSLWARAQELVAASTSGGERRLTTVGIAKDRVVGDGLRHLEKIGSFDEVSVGRGWANMGVIKYVHSDHRGPAVTPQMLLLHRRIVNENGAVLLADEVVLNRWIGIHEIREWSTMAIGDL
jgi:hypothetical protein